MDPKDMTQDQRQTLWTQAGHSGVAPIGYGGEAGGGISTGNPGDDMITASIKQYQNALNDYNNRYKQFTTNNPFVFDDVLKKEQQQVKDRLDPYYNQVLGDFMRTAEIKKSRSLEDERKLLGEMNLEADQYVGNKQQLLHQAMDQTSQQYSTEGLGEGGGALRSQGEQAANTNTELQQYGNQQAYQQNQIQTAGQRLRGYDIPQSQAIEQRQVGQEENYNTQAQALTAAQNAQNQYQFNRQQYAGNMPGVPVDQQGKLYNLLGTTQPLQ